MSTSTVTSVTIAAGAAVLPRRLLKLSSGKVIHAEAKADAVIGCSSIDGQPTTDAGCMVTPAGIVKLIASDAIVFGAQLMAVAGGKAATHDGSATAKFVGQALSAAGADGDVFMALLYDNKNQVPDAT